MSAETPQSWWELIIPTATMIAGGGLAELRGWYVDRRKQKMQERKAETEAAIARRDQQVDEFQKVIDELRGQVAELRLESKDLRKDHSTCMQLHAESQLELGRVTGSIQTYERVMTDLLGILKVRLPDVPADPPRVDLQTNGPATVVTAQPIN